MVNLLMGRITEILVDPGATEWEPCCRCGSSAGEVAPRIRADLRVPQRRRDGEERGEGRRPRREKLLGLLVKWSRHVQSTKKDS